MKCICKVIFIIEILTWTAEGAAIGTRNVVDYVYEVPAQGSGAFYGNGLASSPIVVDNGDDLRYRQEELLYSPGNEDDPQVRPDVVFTEEIIEDVGKSDQKKSLSGAEEDQKVQQAPGKKERAENLEVSSSTTVASTSTAAVKKPRAHQPPKGNENQTKKPEEKKDNDAGAEINNLQPAPSKLGNQPLADAFTTVADKPLDVIPTSKVAPVANVVVSKRQAEDKKTTTPTPETTTISTEKPQQRLKKRENEKSLPPPEVTTTEKMTKETTTEIPNIVADVAAIAQEQSFVEQNVQSPITDSVAPAVLVSKMEKIEIQETTTVPENKREVTPDIQITSTTTVQPPTTPTSTTTETLATTTTTTTTVPETTLITTEETTIAPKIAPGNVIASKVTVVEKSDVNEAEANMVAVTLQTSYKEQEFSGGHSSAEAKQVKEITVEEATTLTTVEQTSTTTEQITPTSLSVIEVPIATQKEEQLDLPASKVLPERAVVETDLAQAKNDQIAEFEVTTKQIQIEIDLPESSGEPAPGSHTNLSGNEHDTQEVSPVSSSVATSESKLVSDDQKGFLPIVQVTQEVIADSLLAEPEKSAPASSPEKEEDLKLSAPTVELANQVNKLPKTEQTETPSISVAKRNEDMKQTDNLENVQPLETSSQAAKIEPDVLVLAKRGINSDDENNSDDRGQVRQVGSAKNVEDVSQKSSPDTKGKTTEIPSPEKVIALAKQVLMDEVTEEPPEPTIDKDEIQREKNPAVSSAEPRKDDAVVQTNIPLPQVTSAKLVVPNEEDEEESEEKTTGKSVADTNLKEIAPGNSADPLPKTIAKVETDEEDSDENDNNAPASSLVVVTTEMNAIQAPGNSIDSSSQSPGKSKSSGELGADSAQTESEEEESESIAPVSAVMTESTTTSKSLESPSKQTDKDHGVVKEESSSSDESEDDSLDKVNHVKREENKQLIAVIRVENGDKASEQGGSGSTVKDTKRGAELKCNTGDCKKQSTGKAATKDGSEEEDDDEEEKSPKSGSEEQDEEKVTKDDSEEKPKRKDPKSDSEEKDEGKDTKGDSEEKSEEKEDVEVVTERELSKENDDDEDEEDKDETPAESFRISRHSHGNKHTAKGHSRRRRDSSGDEFYYPQTRGDSVFYGTFHNRYKRSPEIGNIRQVLLNGKKVYMEVPETASPQRIPESSADMDGVRKTRQTVNDLLNLATPKATRFPPAFCELEKDSGILCPGIRRGVFLEQFYYDSGSNRCSHFVYNGCGGNANRFSTLWECTQFCGKKQLFQHGNTT